MDDGPGLPPERPDPGPPWPPDEAEPRPRWSLGHKVLAAAVAVLTVVAVVVGVRGRARTPVVRERPDGTGARELARGRDYAFTALRPEGDPVRWNPCAPIHYVTNLAQAPEGALDDVREAVRRVSAATGIEFVYDGTTAEVPSRARRAAEPDLYGEGWDPLVIAWLRPEQTDIELGDRDDERHAVARAAPLASTVDSDDVFVSGVIVLDATHDAPAGFDLPNARGLVLMHELGHALGLDHVTSQNEVMNQGYSATVDWGRGDRFALRQVGRRRGCLSVPPPPMMCYAAPPASLHQHALVDADVSAAGDVWAVGHDVLLGRGGEWQVVEVPPGLEARGVAALDRGALVVGVDRAAEAPVAFRVGETSLEVEDVPVRQGFLHAVSTLSSDDAWAVGSSGGSSPLIVHWDGRRWSRVPAPSLGAGAELVDVWATGTDDAWAVGSAGGRSHVLRWDGSAWKRVDAPVGDVELYAVAATGSDDVWLAGARGFTGVVFRFHDDAWETLEPIEDADGFYGAAIGPDGNVWLAGRRSGETGLANPLLARFDGRRWRSYVAEARLAGERAVFYAAAPLGRETAFAFGGAGKPEDPLVEVPC